MDLIIPLVIVSAIFAIFIISQIIARPGESKSLTGPKFSFPILGHLPLLGKEPWVTLTQWKKHYGNMFAIKMGIYNVIVLNESNLIKEAFGRSEFSGRPPFEVYKAATRGKGIGLNDGPLVAEQRNFAIKSLRGFGLRTNLLHESIHLELNQVLEDIDKKCGQRVTVKGMFSIPAMNAIWNIFMGHRFDHDDPKLLRISQAVANSVTDDGPLAALSMFVPPISKLMPELSGRRQKIQAIRNVYNLVQEALDESLPPTRTFGDPQNFKEAFIDEMERAGDNLASSFHPTHNFFLYSAGDLFMTSMETISTTLVWLLLCMAKHPVVQKKVQEEIDEKFGTTRRPELSDKDNTPYVDAVIQELLRFSSITPLGFCHRATEDTEFRGYKIKEDTLFIANLYGVNHDEDIWADPEIFRPERFIDASGTVDRDLVRTMLPFSTGKRSCIGENLARDQIYLYCTSIFQQFDVSCDEDVTLETTVGLVRAPKDFKLNFARRFTD